MLYYRIQMTMQKTAIQRKRINLKKNIDRNSDTDLIISELDEGKNTSDKMTKKRNFQYDSIQGVTNV